MSTLFDRKALQEEITLRLAIMQTCIKWQASRGLNDHAKIAEDVMASFLNALCGWQLINLNQRQANYPAADLGDAREEVRVAVQITVQHSVRKVSETHEKARDHNLAKDFDRLIILFLLDKAPGDPTARDFKPCPKPKIEKWAFPDLAAKLEALDLTSLRAVLDVLRREMSSLDSLFAPSSASDNERKQFLALSLLLAQSPIDAPSSDHSDQLRQLAAQFDQEVSDSSEWRALQVKWRGEDREWQQTVTTTLTHTTRWHKVTIRLILIALVLLFCIVGILHARRISQEKEAKERRKQAAEQNATLADLTKKLDEIKLDRAASGQSFRDLTKEDLERLLAEKAAITVQELRRRIATGAQSPDKLERARALILKGEFDAALKETAELEKTPTDDLIEVLNVKAQAHDGKFQYKEALAARQKITALIDKEKDPAAWAAAQDMVADSRDDLGNGHEAETILREVIATYERLFGPEHPDTLDSRDNLGEALRAQEKNAEAEIEHRAVFLIRERVLGPEHPDTLTSRDNLAIARRGLGKNTEAEAEHRAVIALRERLLGRVHTDTLRSRNNLAEVLLAQGKYAEAEAEHRAVLALAQQQFGPEHPHSLASRNNFANALGEGGKNAEAEAEYRAVLAACLHLFGREHPRTLGARSNLAWSLAAEGKNEAAEAEFRSVLPLMEHALGFEHPLTLLGRNNFAGVLRAQEKNAEAEAVYRAVIVLMVRNLGSEHRHTLLCRMNLAIAMRKQGKNEEAEAEHRTVLAVRERVLGPEHPDTLTSRYNLALTLQAQQKNAEAELIYRTVIAARGRVLGPEHPDTLACQNNFANVLRALGKNAEAEAEHRAVLAVRERVLGPEHADTLASRNNLANALKEQGKNAEAEAEHRAVLAVRERVLGAEHPDTLTSRNNLAGALGEQGKTAEAEAEHRAVLAVRERVLGPEHPDTLQSHFNLSLYLESQADERDKADEKAAARAHWREALDHARTVQAVGARVFGPEHPYLPGFDQQVADLEAKLKE